LGAVQVTLTVELAVCSPATLVGGFNVPTAALPKPAPSARKKAMTAAAAKMNAAPTKGSPNNR
jgi:hypothetical protein